MNLRTDIVMKKLFKVIRDGNLEDVKQFIENKPELVNCVAKQPPKKDDGQSPLQVSLKTGNTEIAEYLLDKGADVNFIEDESCCNAWRAPVIHDAINCAVMQSRWNTNDKLRGFVVHSEKAKAVKALHVLTRLIEGGADVNAVDSYGNSCLNRFGLQASQILPQWDFVNQCERESSYTLTDELKQDLYQILKVLKEAGANSEYISPNLGISVREFYKNKGAISVVFREVFDKS